MASSGSLVAANAAQLLTFALLARWLGPSQFGLYVQVTAITTVAVHLCGLGANDCLIRRVARDRAMYPTMLGHTLTLVAITGAALVAIGMGALPFIITVDEDPVRNVVAIAFLLVTNIVLVRVILLTEQAYISHSMFAEANRSVIFFALARTATAALACPIFGVTTLEGWTAWQFGGHVVVAAYFAWKTRELGRPKFGIVRDEVKPGVFFSSQFIFRAIRQNCDLFILGLVSSIEVVGSYGVARRILDSSYLTIDALNRLVYPRFAVASQHGVHNALPMLWKVLAGAVVLGLGTGLGLFIMAPLLPYLFGHEYVSLVPFVRTMCWLIVFVAIWSVAMDLLGASSHQGARALIVNTASILGAGLVAFGTWWWPPTGTFISLYVTEIGVTIATWAMLMHMARKSEAAAKAKEQAKDEAEGMAAKPA
ncbi:lipopolysaccharide biosynthesis protein [Chenggangzhangella methanolivorans]|uniref:lipopolysaccharide biosynthesis protein n=2 Tax=Chenggangzhangella methanolivorans TaxID=1437009 RepID=UPI003620631E